jgi:hypothetical protein
MQDVIKFTDASKIHAQETQRQKKLPDEEEKKVQEACDKVFTDGTS